MTGLFIATLSTVYGIVTLLPAASTIVFVVGTEEEVGDRVGDGDGEGDDELLPE
jgi:hypothetical protein